MVTSLSSYAIEPDGGPMKIHVRVTSVWLTLSFAACMAQAPGHVLNFTDKLPQRAPVAMREIRVLTRVDKAVEEEDQSQGNSHPGKENSGIVKSRSRDDLYWVHNDSGDDPKIYPIHSNGDDYAQSRYSQDLGVTIAGAINVDWEDITTDRSGNLIIADLGNNANDRRDLVLYIVPEPSPKAGRTTFLKRYFVRYPDQDSFPAPRDSFNFDCEGVFTVGDQIYCFSKNRSDRNATLYRLDDPKSDSINTLTKLETIHLNGQVVGADASVDGLRLVVITYDSIWIFERASEQHSFFEGGVLWAPYQGNQVEAVCFGESGIIKMIDEVSGSLFEVDEYELTRLR